MRPTVHRHVVVALAAALVVAAVPASAPAATSSTADVRVEGAVSTLFEGPITSAGNPIKASSDTVQRKCDGTNLSAHPTGGATATGAAVEGLRAAGLDFDGKWFPGYDDYYITRLGPDAEVLNTNTYWGILVDDAFTDVGGCQVQTRDGDRVLWAYDAFHERGFLRLAATGDPLTGGNPAPTATVVVHQPLSVTVARAYGEKNPQYAPVGGMAVAPVSTAADGAQTVDTASPSAVVSSGIDGTATLVFSTPGWHRVKADGGLGGPIRSNRLDVCVVASAGGSCGAAPSDTQPRSVPPLPPDPTGPGNPQGSGDGTGGGKQAGGGTVQGAPVIELPRFTSAGAKAGRIALSWRILQAGVGVKAWSLSSRAAGATSGVWTIRARGTKGTSAKLALPGGRTWTIRATFADQLGRKVTETVGDVLVPLDAGARAVRRSGPWTRKADNKAWLGAVHRGRAGARLTTTLGAGKVVVLVRGVRAGADIEITAGGKRAIYRVSASATTAAREIVSRARARAGSVTVRVVRGQAGIDGVGTRP